MPKAVPERDADAPSLLFRTLTSLADGESCRKSTMFMYESGLTFPQILVLDALAQRGPEPISALAGRLKLSLGATSQLIDRLVEGEFVAREEDATDRRVRLVRMRHHGEAFMDRLNETRRQELREAFERLPPGVRDRLTQVLRDAVASLGEEERPAPAPGPATEAREGGPRPKEAAVEERAPSNDWANW